MLKLIKSLKKILKELEGQFYFKVKCKADASLKNHEKTNKRILYRKSDWEIDSKNIIGFLKIRCMLIHFF